MSDRGDLVPVFPDGAGKGFHGFIAIEFRRILRAEAFARVGAFQIVGKSDFHW